MTGGGGEKTLHINEQLAYVAKHHNLAIGRFANGGVKDESEGASIR